MNGLGIGWFVQKLRATPPTRHPNLESIKDMGKLMSIIKNDYAGEVDMGLVGKIAKSKLIN